MVVKRVPMSGIALILLALILVVSHRAAGLEQAEKLRDPTLPLSYVAQKTTKTKLNLQAVFIRGNKKEAVINGQRIVVGGFVYDAQIVSINEKSVVYKRRGTTARLYLRKSIIDKK